MACRRTLLACLMVVAAAEAIASSPQDNPAILQLTHRVQHSFGIFRRCEVRVYLHDLPGEWLPVDEGPRAGLLAWFDDYFSYLLRDTDVTVVPLK